MDAEIKKAWVEALRSGKYKQGRSVLRSASDEFCCLGVLCDVRGVQWRGNQVSGCYYAEDSDGCSSAMWLPNSLKEELGLSEAETELADKNDGGEPFSAIADYIETHL